ncbi:hypothetical protein JST97_27310 [bacterium]|nr:hypothetical protein [bacterium]
MLVLILLTFVGGFSIGSASVEPYQVTINGNPSKVRVGHDKDSLILPLALPVSNDQEDWTISLTRDEKAHKLDVKMTSLKKKLRGDTDCYYCTGSGNCTQDYPVGSGVNYAGATEYICSGTGKCVHCSGTGKL